MLLFAYKTSNSLASNLAGWFYFLPLLLMMSVLTAFLNLLRFTVISLRISMSSYNESSEQIAQATEGYVMQQTMLRIKDPKLSIEFYENVLGMKLLGKYDFPAMKFTLYFLGYEQEMPKGDDKEKTEWVFGRPALIELTHNWGTESDDSFTGYVSGNEEPKGFGHIGISVPDVYAACERFAKYDVEFIKKPDDGSMKGLAFIKDPDGYWIEILSPAGITDIIQAQ